MKAINPALNKLIKEYAEHLPTEVEASIRHAHQAFPSWASTSIASRSKPMLNMAKLLRSKIDTLAEIMTLEMGKPIAQSRAEVEKSATACDFYASHAGKFLKDELIATDARKSFISFEPLGVILGVMPWNFPFWQVYRFIAPTLMAGNTVLLKHASNVPGCALAIEALVREAGFPEHLFKVLLIQPQQVQTVIADERVKAITLTGSEAAGMAIGSAAGKFLKKTVLELGGSDPYIVLEDADMETSVSTAVKARLVNNGQSCIAAKRFIVTRPLIERFTSLLLEKLKQVKVGNPLDKDTEVGPLARSDLVDILHDQVQRSIDAGARLLHGGKRVEGAGCFYLPTVLTNVKKGMPAFDEETFGPVFAIIAAKDADEAIALANDSTFGLGASLWTQNLDLADRLARRIQAGSVFINSHTVSNVLLPFGGIKKSGYGRELSHYGIKEFVNIKTIYIT